MTDANSFAVSMPQDMRAESLRAEQAVAIDVSSTYRFAFVKQRWLNGVGSIIQGLLMGGIGVFLLSQMASTPNLLVQTAILGTILTIGGVVLLAMSSTDFFGKLTIDQQGIRASQGLSSFQLDWTKVQRWRVNEVAAKLPDLSSVEVWTTGTEFPRTIAGGRLSLQEHRFVHRLMQTFAADREST